MSAEPITPPAEILKKHTKKAFSRKIVSEAVLTLNLNNAHVERVQNDQTYPRWFSRSLIIVRDELVNADLLQGWERNSRTAQ